MNTMTLIVPLRQSLQGAASAGHAVFRLASQARRAVWAALAASGEARARRHLLEFAAGCEGLQPELARELRAASRQITVR